MSTVLRAIFGYLFLVFMVRVVGRRPGKQMTPFEFVLIFFIGGLVLTPLVGSDHSVTNALVVIITIALLHYAIAWYKQRSIWFTLIVDGTPLVLVEKDKWVQEVGHASQVTADDVMAAARDHGLSRLDQVDYAVLERNGEISVIAAQKEDKANNG